MARTRKSIQSLNLYKFDVLIEDRSAKSDYFRLSQFDGYFYGGRNSILIGGSTVLQPRSKILVEILDKNGSSVYSSPVSTFIEGNSRLVQIEVYNDTPIGQGKIIILGCADTLLDGTPVPPEWKDKYNVRWMGNVTISPLIENKTPIRFTASPRMVVEEKFYLAPSSSVFSSEASASIDLQLSTKFYNVFPNGYLLKATGPTTSNRFFNKYLDGIVTGSIKFNSVNGPETASISLPVSKIYNSTLAETEGALIYTDKKTLIRAGFISSSGKYETDIDPYGIVPVTSSIKLQYNELSTQSTGSRISFAKIRLVDLNTISGEIHKVRFSYKSSTEQGEFATLGEVRNNVAELLTRDTGSVTGENLRIVETGKFSDIIIDDYWYAETMSLVKNQLNFVPPTYYNTSSLVTTQNIIKQCCTDLLDSINATPEIENGKYKLNNAYFIGTRKSNTVQLFPKSEYTLAFNAVVLKESASIGLDQSDYSMEVYLVPESGSTDTKLIETNRLGQLIGTVTPQPDFSRQNFDTVELNFRPQINSSGNFGLRFVIYGGFWNIANVSVKTAQEPFFSPDELDALLPNLNYAGSLLTFKADYLDINNNSVGISTLSLPTYFTGSIVSGSGGDSYPFIIETNTFVGDGVTSNYTLSKPYDNTSIIVSVDGLTYTETKDYSLAASTLSFVSAPPSQSNILVRAFLNVTENLTGSFSGSFLGNISNADFAISSSYAQYAANAFPYSGSALITGSLTVSGSGVDVTGTTSLQAIIEKASVSATVTTGTVNYDVMSQVVLYHTADASGNWTLNFRGNASKTLNDIMATGQVITAVFLVTNGSSAYYPTAHQIDGNSITPKWQGGISPSSGTTNAVDIYTYTIIKTGNAAFTVFASQVMFV
jgi:hypothetical protein